MNLYLRMLLLWIRTRRARPLSLWDEGRVSFRVLPNDLDVLRHMNNGRYLTLLDLGRTDLMMRSGFWQKVQERGWYSVVAAQTITYKRSLTLWQKFDITTRVLGHDGRSVYMQQEFRRGATLIARATIQARFLRTEGGTVPLDDLFALAGGEPEHLELPGWVEEWASAVRITSQE
ncbi:acyl-CoA thioesterase [Microbacterium indicum]|uniref:acyl-CoA thioesterase n=1 Tax=Microbacterium indicum TaxID=358100 RepID=UPI0003F90BF8|nr:acyl-CoA thioesterase [Microbacterium indicum]